MTDVLDDYSMLYGATIDAIDVSYRNSTVRVHFLLPRGGSAWLRCDGMERMRVSAARAGVGASVVARFARGMGERVGITRLEVELATGGLVVVEASGFEIEQGSGT